MTEYASIGAVTCFDVRGRPPGDQEAVTYEEIPGLDGVEIETLGLRGGPFVVIARKIDTGANIESWIEELEELAGGEPVTISPADGTTFANCYIGGPEGGSGVAVQEKIAIELDGVLNYDCIVAVSGYRHPG